MRIDVDAVQQEQRIGSNGGHFSGRILTIEQQYQ